MTQSTAHSDAFSTDPLVHQESLRRIVLRMKRSLNLYPSFEELFQMANTGLMEALHRYDPACGAPVMGFAHNRVRGAILDGCRLQSGRSRRQIQKIQAAQRANDYVESFADANADLTDADYVGQAVQGVMFATALSDISERDDITYEESDGEAWNERVDKRISRAQLRALVVRVVEELPAFEAAILRGHYFEERSLSDIGDELGVTRSWVSRLHVRALERARELLREQHGIGDAALV